MTNNEEQELRNAALPERFLDKVAFEPNTGCWLWLGALGGGGYGAFQLANGSRSGRQVRAHRYAFEVVRGPIPAGLQLDHFKCDTKCCVNPYHVRPVTHRENTLRSNGPSALNAGKTHCHAGHPFDEANTYWDRRGRRCRRCNRERMAATTKPLSPARRSEIARMGGKARWGRPYDSDSFC